jgi:hypothetical protein
VWRTPVFPASVAIMRSFKPTQAIVPRGLGPILRNLLIFQYFKLGRISKLQNATFWCSKIYQTLEDDRLLDMEQHSILRQVQIPKRI